MTDQQIDETWAALEPTSAQRRRIDARVSAWLEARETSLLAEWLGLFRLHPLPALGLVSAGACAVAVSPPILWFVLAVV